MVDYSFIQTGYPSQAMIKIKSIGKMLGEKFRNLRIGRTNEPERRLRQLRYEYGIPERAIMYVVYETSSVDYAMQVEDELNTYLCQIQNRCKFNYAGGAGGSYSEDDYQYVYIVAW